MQTSLRALLEAQNDPDAFNAAIAEVADLDAVEDEIGNSINELRGKESFTDEDVATASALADVFERIVSYRAAKDAELVNAEKVNGFASRIKKDEPAAPEGEPDAPEAAVKTGQILERLSARTSNNTAVARLSSTESGMIAAPDVPGIVSGSHYNDWTHMAQAAIRRWKSMGPAKGRRVQSGLAVFNKQIAPEFVAQSENAFDIIEAVANERRLPGGSLVAAGGWCAPSMPLYEVCEMESRDGLIDTPEFQAMRGGVIHSPGPSFFDIYSNVGFFQSEQDAIDGDEKPCFNIDCPEFDDTRLGVSGVCITAGILQNAAYPEFIARFLRGAMIAHIHQLNAVKIGQIETGSTTVDLSALPYFTQQGATSGLLEAIEMQVMDMRYRNRLSLSASLEVILPAWAKGLVRADLSKRTGVDLLSVTDQMINDWAAQRGAHLQFVYDWQDAFVDAGVGMGGDTPATAWPTTVKFLIFPAGTWVAATRDVILLDAGIYDSVNITTNTYTALFTEEGIAMLKRCPDSRVVTVPICASGSTAVPVDMDCAEIG